MTNQEDFGEMMENLKDGTKGGKENMHLLLKKLQHLKSILDKDGNEEIKNDPDKWLKLLKQMENVGSGPTKYEILLFWAVVLFIVLIFGEKVDSNEFRFDDNASFLISKIIIFLVTNFCIHFILVTAFFGYKLYKSLTERQRKREEKQKAKQLKKKK